MNVNIVITNTENQIAAFFPFMILKRLFILDEIKNPLKVILFLESEYNETIKKISQEYNILAIISTTEENYDYLNF